MPNDQPNDDAEHITAVNVPLQICAIHNKKEWMNGDYIKNDDNTVSCKVCGWGTFLPGYMRFIDGKVVDLRIKDRP